MRYRRYRLFFTLVIVIILMVINVFPAFALENAFKFSYITNRGAYSLIVTGNPTLRGTDYRFSYMRVAVQRIINGNVYYVEVGWLKSSDPHSNFTPRSYYTYRKTDGTTGKGWGGYPGIGIGYNYQVKWSATNTYNIYFNSLSTPLTTINVGWDDSDTAFSGGETSDSNQGMGDSWNNNVAYFDTNGKAYQLCGTENNHLGAYIVQNGSTCYSWRVYGNN